MKTKVRQSEATMCSEWGLVAYLSRIFFISSHLVSQRCRPKTDFGRSFAYARSQQHKNEGCLTEYENREGR
jgi:hypothetical protein